MKFFDLLPLISSLIALWLAPVFYIVSHKHARTFRFVDTAIVIVLALLVTFHLLPMAYRLAGWIVLLVALWGAVLPSALERLWHSVAQQVHWVPLLLGTLGLALHATLDGAALVQKYAVGASASLSWAVVMHRIPEGLFIWWTLYPKFGWKMPVAILALVTVFTLIGHTFGFYYFESISLSYAIGLFQALVAGSLLHLAFDRHNDHGHHHH